MTSLQARLSTGLISALILLTVLAVAVGGYSLRQMAENFVAARLEHDLETVLAALSFDASGQPQLATDRIGANAMVDVVLEMSDQLGISSPVHKTK